MTDTRSTFLRELMAKAWFIFRNRSMPGCRVETFADALRQSWAWFKRQAAPVAAGPTLALRSMLQSPIRRSLRGAHGETRARELGYLTSMMGR